MQYIQPFDQPSNPTAAYVDLNAPTGTDGSIPPAAFFNVIQAEILNVITGAGLTPNGALRNQLLQAILALIPPSSAPSQISQVHYGVLSGTNMLTTTLSPAITSIQDGLFMQLTPAAANTGAATIVLNGLTAMNFVQIDGSALPPGALQAGQPVLAMTLSGQLLLVSAARTSNIQSFTGSGTYTPTPGARKAIVTLTGGGGAGSVHVSCGAGGAAGETKRFTISLSGVSSVPVIIGSGGAGVLTTNGSSSIGGNGGDSSFGAYATAKGGQGAQGYDKGGNGGTGGAMSAAGLSIPGGDGNTCYSGPNNGSGNGGASFWGGGGAGADAQTSTGVGYDGKAYGSGGGGGDSGAISSGSPKGGNGAPGVCEILEL